MRRLSKILLPTLMLTAALLCLPASARADGPGDGLYGRWDQDFTLEVGLGGGVTFVDDREAASLMAELRLRIIDAAGPFLAARWGPDAGESLVVGVELRPLFPALFLMDLSTGRERLDLFVQSLGLEIGAAFFLDGEVDAGLAIGMGLELPLVLPSQWAQGVWLRVAARRVFAPRDYLNLGDSVGRSEWTLYASLNLEWGANIGAGAWEPPRYR